MIKDKLKKFYSWGEFNELTKKSDLWIVQRVHLNEFIEELEKMNIYLVFE